MLRIYFLTLNQKELDCRKGPFLLTTFFSSKLEKWEINWSKIQINDLPESWCTLPRASRIWPICSQVCSLAWEAQVVIIYKFTFWYILTPTFLENASCNFFNCQWPNLCGKCRKWKYFCPDCVENFKIRPQNLQLFVENKNCTCQSFAEESHVQPLPLWLSLHLQNIKI